MTFINSGAAAGEVELGRLGSLCSVIRTWCSRKLVEDRFGSAFAEVLRGKASAVARSLSETGPFCSRPHQDSSTPTREF
jgi:hypothetical protein